MFRARRPRFDALVIFVALPLGRLLYRDCAFREHYFSARGRTYVVFRERFPLSRSRKHSAARFYFVRKQWKPLPGPVGRSVGQVGGGRGGGGRGAQRWVSARVRTLAFRKKEKKETKIFQRVFMSQIHHSSLSLKFPSTFLRFVFFPSRFVALSKSRLIICLRIPLVVGVFRWNWLTFPWRG